MHILVKTLCTCSGSMVLMMHVSMTRLPTKRVSDLEDNHKLRRGVRGESRFSQPRYLVRSEWQSRGCSAHDALGSVTAALVMGWQRHQTQRIEWEILKHSKRMHVNSPKVPKCTCHANACSRRDMIIFIYLFIYFQSVVSKTMRNKIMIGSWSKHDRDINTNNILVLQHV
jgi:hypothetical protein